MHTDRRAETSDAALHRADGDSHSEAAWCWERVQQARDLSASDLAEELGEVAEQIQSALGADDDALVGRLVRAVWNNQVDRLTDRQMGVDAEPVTAIDVALKVLLQASVERAKARAEH